MAGIADFAVDPCFDGCGDGPSPDAPPDGDGPRSDARFEEGGGPDAPLRTPGLSAIAISGTGVAVGQTAIITLVTRDDTGNAVKRTGSKVLFTTSGGTSVVTIGGALDKGDGTYRATLTGVTEGTKLAVSATLDGSPLSTPPASLRVANPVRDGLAFHIDAANADAMGSFGGKGCPAAGLGDWTDLGVNAFRGALAGFADPCGAASGWTGAGSPESPFRLAFDGVNDHVNFGAVNGLPKYTILAWMRRTGAGHAATSGAGGLDNVVPIVTKGTAENEMVATDVNYFLGIAANGHLASDYESTPGSANAPLVGATLLAANTWYMVGTTLDASVATRALWLNGAVDATGAPALPPSAAQSAIFVVGGSRRTDANTAECTGANNQGCGRFQGDIAAVLTYDHVLTQAEIETNCHSLSSRFGIMTCPN